MSLFLKLILLATLIPLIFGFVEFILPSFRWYRKLRGGFWFAERKPAKLTFWIRETDPAYLQLMDEHPGVKDSLMGNWILEDYRR